MVESRDRINVALVESDTALDYAEAAAFTTVPEAGGICLFAGVTREFTGGQTTVELSYESYEPMAVSTIRKIAEEVMAAHDVARIYVRHRIGVVPVGEPSVLIAVSAPHRDAAFRGCRYVIDELKLRAPIWKKEHLTDGTAFWVEGDAPSLPKGPATD